jgi:3',5'-cyclic AMP phosphodiesterase CpdA
MKTERKLLIRSQKPARERVIGASFEDALREIARQAPVDLLCFSGDVADWGLEQEYIQASNAFERIRSILELDPKCFFVVPGNHDVNRGTEQAAWSEMRKLLSEREDVAHQLGNWALGARVPAGVDPALMARVLKRLDNYWSWIRDKQGCPHLVPGLTDNNHPSLGFRVSLRLERVPFSIHVVGLNSAWLCGDDHDKGKLMVTREQVDWLCHDDGKPLDGFRLAVMHHPLGDLADWDSAEVRRTLADTVDLLLHGHQHDPNFETRIDPDRSLKILAAGSLYEGDKGDRFFNSFHVIDVRLDEHGRNAHFDVTFYGWSNRGFWHRTDAVYRISQNGTLSRSGSLATPAEPAAIVPEETLRNAWHPRWDISRRGPLKPCRFRINVNYKTDGESRWEQYGDVLVNVEHPPTCDDIYLVPSRHAPKRFQHPKDVIKSKNNGPKKHIIEQFVRSVGDRMLEGFWFMKLMSSDNSRRPHVYSKELDDVLNANAAKTERDLVYISYKSSDNEWRLRLRAVLDADERITVWDDSRLIPGSDFREDMKAAVNRARVMIVFASDEYLNSPLPTELELTPAIAAAQAKELSLLWVTVRSFDWKSTPLARYMAAIDPGKSLEQMAPSEWEAALYRIYTIVCAHLGFEPRPKPAQSFLEKMKAAGLT